MDFYHFSEQPYTEAWDEDRPDLRLTIPNSFCDPKIAQRIYQERLDEWVLCDELGLNVMLNEHHAASTCLSVSPTLHLAILARITKRARLLACGIPLANRPDPLRIAEELAMIDVISGGRVEMGFIKGSPFEISPNNSNPVRMMDRFWEAHDFILKVMSARNGPISWEGEHFHYRMANVWPQPWQQPHPPVWITAQSPDSTREIAKRGHRLAVFLAGWNMIKLTELYTSVATEHGHQVTPDRFAYMAVCAVGETREQGYDRMRIIQGFLATSRRVGDPFLNPPGYMNAQGNAAWLAKNQRRGRSGAVYPVATKDGRMIDQGTAPPEDLAAAGVAFTGSPDDVYQQICDFSDHVGGIGHFLLMFQGGKLSHKDAKDNISLFAREVMPRLKERYGDAVTRLTQAA